ncbi:MAG TPA: class I SAM-dependent methyltransferase [Kofleriaceae bacterium]|nr:class I SAM-dependent methyltransferase [Kofleriaceae bacterium]
MQRVREPELMNEPTQAAAYAAADFAEVNQGFVDRFLDLTPEPDGWIIDLGCGPGDIALRLCRAAPTLRVLGVDGAAEMIALARRATSAAGLADRVEWHCARLPGAVPGRRFDGVISNSLLHHLPMGEVLWREIEAVAAPGAPVLVVDLMRPESTEAARALVERYSQGEPEILRTDFYNSLLAAFTPDEVRAQLESVPGLAGLEIEAISDRHLAVLGRIG